MGLRDTLLRALEEHVIEEATRLVDQKVAGLHKELAEARARANRLDEELTYRRRVVENGLLDRIGVLSAILMAIHENGQAEQMLVPARTYPDRALRLTLVGGHHCIEIIDRKQAVEESSAEGAATAAPPEGG